MNQKELREIKRRFAPDKSNIRHLYGCYVNSTKEIIAYIDAGLGLLPQEEIEMYLGLLKKSLSGTLGKNLLDIIFSTEQVMDSEEYRLLQALRNSELKDSDARNALYQKIIDSLDMEDTNYLILLAADTYDVPYRGKDDETQADASEQVFSYFVCCACPVRPTASELQFFAADNEFHSSVAAQKVSAPELGFLFPAFDQRAANLYNALFYCHSAAEIHQEVIDALFHTEAPMSAEEQKAAFETALGESLGADCNFGLVQSVHSQLREQIELHKESKNPEPLTLSVPEVGKLLADCGVTPEKARAFQEACKKEFDGSAELNPANIIDSKKFEITTSSVKITVDPEYSRQIETRILGGRRYVLIPVEEGLEINGVDVSGQDTEQ